MLENVFKGSWAFYKWLGFLVTIIGIGFVAWLFQMYYGLSLTGLSRDVSWGVYIAQFTYMVGVAAGAVMLVLPIYFHHYKKFKRIVIFGEFMAIAAVIVCMLFIVVDLGQPQRMLNVMLHPTPNSIMFWDMSVLMGYLVINAVVGWVTLEAERLDVDPPKWIKFFIYLSIIWAVSIHTVTAFLIAGLPGRHYWLTAVMAPRFLASAFASGPAILLLLLFVLKKVVKFDPGKEAVQTLTKIIIYAMCINIFFFLMEVFTAFYSQIPEAMHPITFLFMGHDGHASWVNGWMWTAVVCAFVSLALLIPSSLRENEKILPWALGLLILACWIDKGLGLMIGGFTPNTFEQITPYTPSIVEILIAMGVFGIGLLILSILWKIALEVKKEAETYELQ
ncbi:sulfate reduction electron transfer complex DsrMKJOP subunit DsrP [Desulfovibrio litoralis]|uniref:Putative sulfite reductase-associated electron transfer protein DsrP n=1 Tax=Desulfovibrio litoralis DSM 11393 TaxID=1121455 RepID=A0A1M7RZV4_9BACT|nr:NrfD/PsrC family molybdoenzyme membrane anchor subunit [Desulfovibrio litoralis]SHN51718.1 putative sulfite reductase-associated electron transfer protein DsrP [Desulfovibrio litoralis DSM 11393]